MKNVILKGDCLKVLPTLPRESVPTQLPVELVQRIIGVSSNPGDIVLDPFAGSGTSLVVAKAMGRQAIGIELNPDYAAIASMRYEGAKTA